MKKHKKISLVMSFMFIFSIILPKGIKVQATEQIGDGNVTVVQCKGTRSSIRVKNALVDVSIEKPVVIGNKVQISINAINISEEAQDVTLITGLYDKNNKLVSYNLAYDKIEYERNVRLTTEVDVPTLELYKLKVFAWDSLQGMTPLIDAVEYTVNGEVIDSVDDIMEPTFHSISVSNNDVDLYDKVSIEVNATDDSDLADEANLCYVSEVNGKVIEKEISLKLENRKYVGELSIDETYGVGNWKVSFITLQDKANNVSIIYNSNIHNGLGIDLSAADINLNNDILAPNFESISIVSDEIEDYFTIRVKASDDVSGLAEEANISYVHQYVAGLSEQQIKLTLENGVYVGKIRSAEATWNVNFITLQDKANNVRIIYNSKVHDGLGQDLSDGKVFKEEDIVAPWFRGVSVNTSNVKLDDNIVIRVEAFENISKLAKEANVCLVSEQNGKIMEKEISLSLTEEIPGNEAGIGARGAYEAKVNIDKDFGIGKWRVSFITLQDVNNNVKIYYNNNVHKYLGEDLSSSDFTTN